MVTGNLDKVYAVQTTPGYVLPPETLLSEKSLVSGKLSPVTYIVREEHLSPSSCYDSVLQSTLGCRCADWLASSTL